MFRSGRVKPTPGILQFLNKLTIFHGKDNDYVAKSKNEFVIILYGESQGHHYCGSLPLPAEKERSHI